MSKRFLNNIVVIAGGSSDIGKATAKLFLQEGAKVIIWDIVKPGMCLTEKKKKNFYYFKVDVLNEENVKKATQQVWKKFKKIDILFNNIGLYSEGGILNCSTSQWKKALDTNLTSVFILCKYVVAYMREKTCGAIINMSSLAGVNGEDEALAYSTSKAGLIGMTKSLARECAKDNIRINCIAAGPVITSTFKKCNTLTDMLEIKRSVPLGRLGKPRDIAKSVLFLASDDASFMTGKVLIIDGGIV